jgi:dethiobiotin synthetase
MLTQVFVTGTDTDVGKTIVSRALLQALAAQGTQAVGYKPVATECTETAEGWHSKDVQTLQAASTIDLPYEALNVCSLAEDEPYAAPADDALLSRMSDGLAMLKARAGCVVVEGCGGWRTLLDEQHSYADWVIAQQLPVILVVGIKQGGMNHALLTAQAVINDGLPLLGWVANRINPCLAHYAQTIDLLSHKIPAPLLGEIPYLPRAETRELGHFLDLSLLAR